MRGGRVTDAGVWNRYWHFDRIASCFDGAGAANYDECVAGGWRSFFRGLPDGARILDLCTGNGAAALIAAEVGRSEAKSFAIHAVDRADIDPPAYVTRHAEDLAAIRFLPATPVEALPFADASFDAAISQYGIEYSDLGRSLPEAVRVLAPGGRLRLVVHAADGEVAAGARTIIAEADLLLGEIDLTGCASRCFEALWAVERAGDEAARPRADSAFAAFQEALERTAGRIAGAKDATMFKNSGAVLFDTFRRRSCFDRDQLLAKAGEVDGEIRAHRGRLVALVEAALDAAQTEALAERLRDAGAAANSFPLRNGAELIGHIVEARFP
jgi:SAM-dependent methyltransferase